MNAIAKSKDEFLLRLQSQIRIELLNDFNNCTSMDGLIDVLTSMNETANQLGETIESYFNITLSDIRF